MIFAHIIWVYVGNVYLLFQKHACISTNGMSSYVFFVFLLFVSFQWCRIWTELVHIFVLKPAYGCWIVSLCWRPMCGLRLLSALWSPLLSLCHIPYFHNFRWYVFQSYCWNDWFIHHRLSSIRLLAFLMLVLMKVNPENRNIYNVLFSFFLKFLYPQRQVANMSSISKTNINWQQI